MNPPCEKEIGMDKMIAMCGLVCTECPLFIATQNDDQDEKRRLAERWSTEQYPLDPEEMFCDGCITAGGRKISFCEVCDVRRCGLEMKVENCAYCDAYPCTKLDKVFAMVGPQAKTILDEIRKGLSS